MQQPNATSPSPGDIPAPDPSVSFGRLDIAVIQTPEGTVLQGAATATSTDRFIPITVRPHKDSFIIIDGVKRFAALKAAGSTMIDCGIIDREIDELHAALLRISLNRGRVFTLGEKLLFVKQLAPYRDRPFYREYGAGIIPDRNELQLIEHLSTCSAELAAAVAGGSVDLAAAASLEQLDPDDRRAAIALFSRFPFSRQMQKELADWLPELAFREKCRISDIIASDDLQSIIAHERLNAPQKIEKIRQTLYERRFPTIVRAKKRWLQHASAINPDSGAVLLKPSDAFEKNRLELKITVTSAAQAREIFNKLSAIPESDWDRLIYPAQMYGDFQ